MLFLEAAEAIRCIAKVERGDGTDQLDLWQGLHKQSKNEKWDLSPESQKSMKYCNSFQLLCTCKNPVVLTVKACRLGIRQENFFHL